MATWQGPGWTLGQAENPDLLHARHSGKSLWIKSSLTPEPWQTAGFHSELTNCHLWAEAGTE